MDTAQVFPVGGFPPAMSARARERQEIDIKPPLGAPFLIIPRGYPLKAFLQDRVGLKSVFPLLGELPKAIEPQLPVCQLYRWQLDLNKWFSPTTKLFDPIVETTLRVGFP